MQLSSSVSVSPEPNWYKIIDNLLIEKFALTNHFDKKTPAEIEAVFKNPLNAEADKKSFHSCLDLFCLFLFEIEKDKGIVPQETLLELRGLDTDKTSFNFNLKTNEETPHLGVLAREYWELSETFAKSDLPLRQAVRLKAQSLCFAVEAECSEKLMKRVEAFWINRTDAMEKLFVISGRRYEFHPEINRYLVSLSEKHGQGLVIPTLLTSLRYLLAVEKWQRLKFSVIELANLFLFFSGDKEVGSVLLKNWIGPHSLTEDQREELAIRLCRLHQLKTQLMTPHFEILQADQAKIERDCSAVLKILGLV